MRRSYLSNLAPWQLCTLNTYVHLYVQYMFNIVPLSSSWLGTAAEACQIKHTNQAYIQRRLIRLIYVYAGFETFVRGRKTHPKSRFGASLRKRGGRWKKTKAGARGGGGYKV